MGLFDFGKQENKTTPDEDDTKEKDLVQSLRDEIASLQQKNRVLDGQNSAYAYTSSTQNERIAHLESLLAEQGISPDTDTEVTKLRKALAEKTAELEQKTAELEAKAEELDTLSKSTRQPDEALESKIKELEWSILEKDSHSNSLEKEIARYKSFIPRAQAAIKNLQAENNRLKQELSEAKSSSDEITKYQEEIKLLQTALSETSLKCEDLEDKLQEAGSLDALKDEIAGLNKTIADLEKQLADSLEDKKALQTKLNQYEAAMSSVSAILNKV